MYQIIDIDAWDRREIYEHFSRLPAPFYEVAADVDVTPLLAYTRATGLSFYLTMIHTAMRSLNAIDNFRMRIVDGRPVLFDGTHPSLTHMKSGEKVFKIYSCPMEDDLPTFVRHASEGMAAQKGLFGGLSERPELAYFSCLPWIEATAITNERNDNADDAIPRVNWGKYAVHADGRVTLNITLTVNHRFIDGYHVGQFFLGLQQLIEELKTKI